MERHNALLRDMLHKVGDQVNQDGLGIPDRIVLAECLFAKNCMISIHGVSPYQGLFGKQPAVLNAFEPASHTALDDNADGTEGVSRHIHRLRAAAVSTIVQGTAMDRLKLADRSKTRMAGELLDLQVGDSVDFWRDPANKDTSGWRGPADVVDLGEMSEGNISVRWQGRVFSCAPRLVRRALVMLVMLSI